MTIVQTFVFRNNLSIGEEMWAVQVSDKSTDGTHNRKQKGFNFNNSSMELILIISLIRFFFASLSRFIHMHAADIAIIEHGFCSVWCKTCLDGVRFSVSHFSLLTSCAVVEFRMKFKYHLSRVIKSCLHHISTLIGKQFQYIVRRLNGASCIHTHTANS